MRIPAAPPTALAALPTVQPELLRPARARMVHPRPVRARMALPRPALLPPAPTVPRQPALPLPAQVRMALPRLALLPPAHPQPAQVRMALPPPVRLLPPELLRAARMVLLLATVLLAAPPLLPRATTAWVSTSLRVNPFPRGSLLIRTSRLPARAAISSPRRTRPIRTVAVTRRTWIIWLSSPVIGTRFPTVSTIRSTPQVVLTAAAPTEL